MSLRELLASPSRRCFCLLADWNEQSLHAPLEEHLLPP